MNKKIKDDLFSLTGKRNFWTFVKNRFFIPNFKLVYYKRRCEQFRSFFPLFIIYRLIYEIKIRKYNTNIGAKTIIGNGFVIVHYGSIVINNGAVIGKNVSILQGVTIGVEKRGKRQGCPTIGDRVWIGSNATIVGKITIGDNVLIGPNCFVNFDVPSDSVVVSGGTIIKHSESGSSEYITNLLT